MNLKKIATSLLAGLLAVTCLLPLTSCSSKSGGDNAQTTKPNDDGEEVTSGEVKVKVLKMGRALAAVIRTDSATVVIDTGDEEHAADVANYLAEKGITTVDAVILTNYSKKCIGGVPQLLKSGITVKAVYGGTYVKDSNAYTLFSNAMASYKLTTTTVSTQQTLTFGDITLTLYPPAKNYSTLDDENDEGNSIALVATYGNNHMLFTSRVAGERMAELSTQLAGVDVDCLVVPNFGAFDDNLAGLLSTVKAEYAVIVASNSNPPADLTLTALITAGIATENTFVTNNGSVEISADGTTFSIKQ
ncbi:MAG: ComEC/Rec2 family competence protein [Eubacteriales bacterium]